MIRPRGNAALVAQTEQAVARGVFGAPTCFVGDEMLFGQDRLEFVREAVGRLTDDPLARTYASVDLHRLKIAM